jgi:hypothetical protein
MFDLSCVANPEKLTTKLLECFEFCQMPKVILKTILKSECILMMFFTIGPESVPAGFSVHYLRRQPTGSCQLSEVICFAQLKLVAH